MGFVWERVAVRVREQGVLSVRVVGVRVRRTFMVGGDMVDVRGSVWSHGVWAVVQVMYG